MTSLSSPIKLPKDIFLPGARRFTRLRVLALGDGDNMGEAGTIPADGDMQTDEGLSRSPRGGDRALDGSARPPRGRTGDTGVDGLASSGPNMLGFRWRFMGAGRFNDLEPSTLEAFLSFVGDLGTLTFSSCASAFVRRT